MDDTRKLTIRVAYLISVIWTVSFVVDIFVPTYEPPPSVHALMVIVAGSLFGESVFRSRRNNDGSRSEPEPGVESEGL